MTVENEPGVNIWRLRIGLRDLGMIVGALVAIMSFSIWAANFMYVTQAEWKVHNGKARKGAIVMSGLVRSLDVRGRENAVALDKIVCVTVEGGALKPQRDGDLCCVNGTCRSLRQPEPLLIPDLWGTAKPTD